MVRTHPELKEKYNVQKIEMPMVFLKGIGHWCPVCKEQFFPVSAHANKQICCSKECTNSRDWQKRKARGETQKYKEASLHAFIKLEVVNEPEKHRIMHLYLNKNHKQIIKITPNCKELWDQLDAVSEFRNRK